MDYKVLEIARSYSDDAETLVKNYNRIVDGIKPSNKYTADDLASFAIYVLELRNAYMESSEPINIENILEDWLTLTKHFGNT